MLRRGQGAAGVAAVAVGLFLGLGALMVAWAAEDTAPQAIDTRHPHDPRAATTTLPAPSTTVTTVAPAPEEPPPPEPEPTAEPEAPARGVHVAGIVVTQPAPEPAPEPDPAPAPAPPPDPGPCPAPGGLLNSHNSIRCQNGLSQVGLDGAMSAHAQFHAERLMNAGACGNLFHSPELSSWYGSGYWGENAACISWSGGCSSDAGTVMDGWMASPEHRMNILNPNYNWIGTGYACDGRHAYFVVQFRS